jgi:hypothetical protein
MIIITLVGHRCSTTSPYVRACAREEEEKKTIEQSVLGDDCTANEYSSILLLNNSYEMAGLHHISFSLSIFLHLL